MADPLMPGVTGVLALADGTIFQGKGVGHGRLQFERANGR